MIPPAAVSNTPDSLDIQPSDRELLIEEVDAFIDSLGDAEARIAYLPLRQAVMDGRVESHLLDALETVLHITLQSGRIRHMHSPQAENALLRLFNKTRLGVAIRKTVEETNQALKALHGQRIDDIAFSSGTPGRYQLIIDTDRCRITLGIDNDGIDVQNVAVGI